MLINDHLHKTGNNAKYHCRYSFLLNFIRSQNAPIYKPEHLPATEEEVNNIPGSEQVLGNDFRKVLIMQHFA